MSRLSTVAWATQNLGLSAWFGGTIFGKLALNFSAKAVDSKEERGHRGGREPGPNRAVEWCKLFAGRPELLALTLPLRSSWAWEKHPPSQGQRRRG